MQPPMLISTSPFAWPSSSPPALEEDGHGKVRQGVILFDTITWYADFRRQYLVELTNFFLLDCASTGASRIAGDTSMGPVQPVLGGLIETLGVLRLASKLWL